MKHSKNVDRTYWVCHLKPECVARASTTDSPLTVHREGQHTHAAEPDYVKAEQVTRVPLLVIYSILLKLILHLNIT